MTAPVISERSSADKPYWRGRWRGVGTFDYSSFWLRGVPDEFHPAQEIEECIALTGGAYWPSQPEPEVSLDDVLHPRGDIATAEPAIVGVRALERDREITEGIYLETEADRRRRAEIDAASRRAEKRAAERESKRKPKPYRKPPWYVTELHIRQCDHVENCVRCLNPCRPGERYCPVHKEAT